MVKPIMRDVLFLGQKSIPATEEDLQVGRDLQDTLAANREACVGTGLNLTAADIVIHYDPWWNVAAQNQATDRAYRIGQQNPVQVYKLIAQDTIEEKIVELQQAKQSLADTVTGTADGAILSMRPDELLQLLEGSEG